MKKVNVLALYIMLISTSFSTVILAEEINMTPISQLETEIFFQNEKQAQAEKQNLDAIVAGAVDGDVRGMVKGYIVLGIGISILVWTLAGI